MKKSSSLLAARPLASRLSRQGTVSALAAVQTLPCLAKPLLRLTSRYATGHREALALSRAVVILDGLPNSEVKHFRDTVVGLASLFVPDRHRLAAGSSDTLARLLIDF